MIMGVLAVLLLEMNISLGYLYELMGTLISSAVCPIAFTLTWRKQTAAAAVSGTIVGVVAGIICWLIAAQVESGVITLQSTFGDVPMLVGNFVSLAASAVVTVVMSLRRPDDFDWYGVVVLPCMTCAKRRVVERRHS